ncbi:hypothetical protein [Streptomyces spectabilis]|uniref:Uncharacterized protein n=1 Tax=Streptomyces spectabilis TaxID=68270 RepID=A0A7W8APZ0_STRST|nr:hypothetical protein [Streptomyces spectabilis]MBB5102459.1 hypothetical protein [Streptomyces spectabilis]MCI3907500.1 hypothetical protein [Streptomyces spectabilis]GGV31724.1 hypothetical protein GCM10010245_51430 [Streptomyces spectabilis]
MAKNKKADQEEGEKSGRQAPETRSGLWDSGARSTNGESVQTRSTAARQSKRVPEDIEKCSPYEKSD